MTYRKLLTALFSLALLGAIGCNPNPGGPSAPSSAPEGTTTPAPADPQKTERGTVSGPPMATRE